MNNNMYEIPEFDYKKFKEEFASGDIWGLNYLEETLIRDYKDRANDNIDGYCWYDYIINLFYATEELNTCNDIYETCSKVENRFNNDLYFRTRDLLFEELGFDLEDLYNWR